MSNQIVVQTQFQIFEKTGKPFQLENKEFQSDLKSGEALVKIILSTICGSDLHTIEGKRKEDTPCVLGHEAVGEIIDINSREGFAIGDRVTWTIANSCGKCPSCTEYGLPEKCDELFKYGHASIHNGSGLNGCYATHILIRKGTHMVKVPDTVSHAAVAPANCALATMVNAVLQTTAKPKRAVVQGGGLLGVYACGLLKEMGVSQIYCLEVNESRFQMIKDFGAIPVDAKNDNAIQSILDATNDGVDAVFEVAGIKQLVPQGLQLLRPGGDYILVGLVHPDSDLGITAEQIIRKCIHIKGVHNYAPWHLDESVAFLERNQGVFPFEKLVSPPYKLEDIGAAVHEAQKQKWMRVSVKP
ncbi:zinc-binding dehydrogenase [Flavivirga spongiicola]|uniref:alcohol dehydrogenase n=1 Tax=Flavivirga spongiicola TaxID=421621 RepID=A0ABU7XTA4_9FLAO|nr:zinc-binding dehydrogenase [Flavivirga sp. MEBiC05379]MDO5979010.1 zinc-binding dehydrogenase [Flavivirga sp. MEBiC05379]